MNLDSVIPAALNTLRQKRPIVHERVLKEWPLLRNLPPYRIKRIIRERPESAAVFFFTVLYDHMQACHPPGYVYGPLNQELTSFGYARPCRICRR